MHHNLHTTLHPLQSAAALPVRFNNPFHYVPHELCKDAFGQLKYYIENDASPALRAELLAGKMLGVLVVQTSDNKIGFLAAYSGQINGSFSTDYFVPAVFDYLDKDGHFKVNERKISCINAEIIALQNDDNYQADKDLYITTKEQYDAKIIGYKHYMQAQKQHRDLLRRSKPLAAEEENALIKESQFQKAEYKRICRNAQNKLAEIQARISAHESKINTLKQKRKQDSENLQNWLFSHFVFSNYNGETKSLLDIFRDFNGKIPPSGSGECCAPKLLQYAYNQHLKPISMAEYWWGDSPAQEIRHHLHHYPACNGKCKPILDFMLQGLCYPPNPLSIVDEETDNQPIEYLYIDEIIVAIHKPAGMLSVPGKSERKSAYQIVKEKFGEVYICHRLDMATSGVLLFARTKAAYDNIHRQFENHEIRKCYLAVIEGVAKQHHGTINLPLRPDIHDRPRQMVDWEYGKSATTEYETVEILNNETYLRLYPLTGRTHQLRVHCAHNQGLAAPIKGDTLYGHHKADRLYLHAESITLRHPNTGKVLTISAHADLNML
ncbi:MAG: RluA family pseudouridine synthase [Bacteroidales bacterium]|nr:RluA family pseudouridine synthase [Bacteroidales bacterium]